MGALPRGLGFFIMIVTKYLENNSIAVVCSPGLKYV